MPPSQPLNFSAAAQLQASRLQSEAAASRRARVTQGIFVLDCRSSRTGVGRFAMWQVRLAFAHTCAQTLVAGVHGKPLSCKLIGSRCAAVERSTEVGTDLCLRLIVVLAGLAADAVIVQHLQGSMAKAMGEGEGARDPVRVKEVFGGRHVLAAHSTSARSPLHSRHGRALTAAIARQLGGNV